LKVPGSLQSRLLSWFAAHGRNLPWRRTRDPYAILVSEVMLQQTQVERVLPKYAEFLERFPTFEALAAAPLGEVIRAWAPLGYNRRAVRLYRIALHVVAEHGGQLVEERAALRRLGGIGEYTAAAVACFAFGAQEPVVDTNVRRALGRWALGTGSPPPKLLAVLAREALPEGRAWEGNQTLMDLGALVCTSRAPRCLVCPLRAGCAWAGRSTAEGAEGKKETPFRGSDRYYRGRIVDELRRLPPGGGLTLTAMAAAVGLEVEDSGERMAKLVEALERDGLAVRAGEAVALP